MAHYIHLTEFFIHFRSETSIEQTLMKVGEVMVKLYQQKYDREIPCDDVKIGKKLEKKLE